MERDKSLDMALSQIEKQYGKNTVMRLGSDAVQPVAAIPTGALSLDLALGIGGVPRGRIVEIYGVEGGGKTSLALHIIAEAQRNGGIAAFIDAEHALDPHYARALGVDIDELLISQPDTGEQALEIADMLIRSGALDVVVIDSVAALVPRAEIEGEMGDHHVGLQARLMSQALRKLAGTINRSDTTAIFINQIREKIGVMFGCFAFSTRVTLADGTQEKIGKIVNQRLPVEVLSYDPEAGAVVPKRVTNWFDNGRTDEFLRFTVAKGGGNGRSQFACTPNHLIRTPGGWREAQEISVGDRVLQAVPYRLSEFEWEVLLGGLMGDSALSSTRSGHGARLRWGHESRQVEYGDWKASLFPNLRISRSTNEAGAALWDMQPLPELAELRHAVYIGGRKVLSWDYLKRLTPLSLAIWYMDDASFTIRSKGKQVRTLGGSGRTEICVEAIEETSCRRLVDHLADTWGIRAKLLERAGKAVIQFPTAETAKLQALVAPYVHPSMDYKLLPRFRGRFAVEPDPGVMRHELVPMPVTKIERKPPNGRHTHRFDIEVEGSHNYFADGVMVHNSPETTPGGRALKFYSSVRIEVRRIQTIKDGQDAIGNRVVAKVVKNKCVAAGSLVFDPATGLTRPIEEVVEDGPGGSVPAVDKQGRLQARPILNRWHQGEQQVIGLRLKDGTTLRVTQDHKVLTDRGWREAGALRAGDRVARPRRFGTFGDAYPIPSDQARLLGYLIGDGYVGGKTPIAFINGAEELHEDAARIAESLGCRVRRRGLEASFSRPGGPNGVLALARWGGIHGRLAWEKHIPTALFADDVAADVIANLLFGIWESDGWISREQTGAVRVGFSTTSEQLAHQLHWLLLRFGVGSTRMRQEPGSRRSLIDGRVVRSERPIWQVRVSGIDNVVRFRDAVPMWGPRGRKLVGVLSDPALAKHRGSQLGYLPSRDTEPVLAYLRDRGITAAWAAAMIGAAAPDPTKRGQRSMLGVSRLRRDRVARLADALDSEFLRSVLDEDVWYDRIVEITAPEMAATYDLEVDELHSFVADGIVVHNCAAPFRNAEFDIMFGQGISREGSLLDVAVEQDVVRKSGAWYTYDDDQLGQGRENAKTFLRENPEVAMQLQARVLAAVGLDDSHPAIPPTAEDEPEAAGVAGSVERVDGPGEGDGDE